MLVGYDGICTPRCVCWVGGKEKKRQEELVFEERYLCLEDPWLCLYINSRFPSIPAERSMCSYSSSISQWRFDPIDGLTLNSSLHHALYCMSQLRVFRQSHHRIMYKLWSMHPLCILWMWSFVKRCNSRKLLRRNFPPPASPPPFQRATTHYSKAVGFGSDGSGGKELLYLSNVPHAIIIPLSNTANLHSQNLFCRLMKYHNDAITFFARPKVRFETSFFAGENVALTLLKTT